MKYTYDMVAIGDCAIDAFIEVQEAKVTEDPDGEHPRLSFPFGDKIPYKSLTLLSAGNANNVAVGISRLGFNSAFYGTVGGDHNAHIILDKLKSEKVNTQLMSIQKNMATNFHFVLWYQSERTILIKHQDFAYALPKAITQSKWIYLTSVGKNGLGLHPQIEVMLEKNTEIKMAFNPGTFQLRLGIKKLSRLFKRTELLFVNKEEAELLVGNHTNIQLLAHALHRTGPNVIVITDGLNGSYCLCDNIFYYVGIYPHKPIEATGAGDAFATGFTAAIMRGLPVSEALRWGSRNGASVATKIGPQAGLVYKKEMTADLASHKKFVAEIKT